MPKRRRSRSRRRRRRRREGKRVMRALGLELAGRKAGRSLRARPTELLTGSRRVLLASINEKWP